MGKFAAVTLNPSFHGVCHTTITSINELLDENARGEYTGRIADKRNELEGESVTGKISVFPHEGLNHRPLTVLLSLQAWERA